MEEDTILEGRLFLGSCLHSAALLYTSWRAIPALSSSVPTNSIAPNLQKTKLLGLQQISGLT